MGRNIFGTWDDIQGNVSSAKLPASNAPTWTTFDFGIGGGIAFNVLGFDTNDYFDFTLQTSHSMKLNSPLDFHIHWTIPSDDAGKRFAFKLDVIAAGVNETFAVPTGSPFTGADVELAVGDSGKHNLAEIATIPAVNTSVSTLYQCRLTRVAPASGTDYGSDVYVLFNDSHYMKDALGSKSEYIKWS